MPSRIAETAENALVRELMVWWRQYNAALFEDALRPPVLALEDTERQLGRWERGTELKASIICEVLDPRTQQTISSNNER